MGRASKGSLKVNFFFGLDEEVKMLIRLASIDRLAIPEAYVAIGSSTDQPIFNQLDKLNFPTVTRSIFINSNNRLNKISLPEQQFAILGRTDHIAVLELCEGDHIG